MPANGTAPSENTSHITVPSDHTSDAKLRGAMASSTSKASCANEQCFFFVTTSDGDVRSTDDCHESPPTEVWLLVAAVSGIECKREVSKLDGQIHSDVARSV